MDIHFVIFLFQNINFLYAMYINDDMHTFNILCVCVCVCVYIYIYIYIYTHTDEHNLYSVIS